MKNLFCTILIGNVCLIASCVGSKLNGSESPQSDKNFTDYTFTVVVNDFDKEIQDDLVNRVRQLLQNFGLIQFNCSGPYDGPKLITGRVLVPPKMVREIYERLFDVPCVVNIKVDKN